MDKNRLGNRKIVLGLISKRDYDRQVNRNAKSNINVREGASKGSKVEQYKPPLENETEESSQTPGQLNNCSFRRNETGITRSPRALRSRSEEIPKVQDSINAPLQDADSKEKKRKKTKKKTTNHHDNEFSKIKRHLKYLLQRKEYEQNFIDAYAGEGWRGQSLEKLRPEKELERAKSDINRYKLKIRDLFKRIDESCAEGRIPESLYDSDGEIDSEDIFCAKCGQTEVRVDNDIILCDGACDRGFHQYCLDPPLLKEQVPPGDEGWLCPACDCKADCVYLVNDYMGTDLSVDDSWEKVFPEATASGDKLDDNLGLPSDDSEDDDYDPDGPRIEEDEVDADGSSSDESDFSSASEDLGDFAKNDEFLGLPSEDSEDDDFNPDRLDSDQEAKNQSSGSDFTSDSEDLDDIKNDVTVASGEVQKPVTSQEEEKLSEVNMENDDLTPITAKRKVERLDYKKLHDETYGNTSSDSSDEDFMDSEAPSRQKSIKKVNKMLKESESSPVGTASEKLTVEDTNSPPAQDGHNKSNNRSSNKRLGEAATQRLYEAFKENHYPDRGVRENLVKELNLTHTQVSKWFENARWKVNHPEGHSKTVKSATAPAEKLVTKQAIGVSSTTPKTRKRKTVADDQTSPMDSSELTTRTSGRIQANKV